MTVAETYSSEEDAWEGRPSPFQSFGAADGAISELDRPCSGEKPRANLDDYAANEDKSEDE